MMIYVCRFLPHWGPAIFFMMVIFLFSAIPSGDLPDFDWADVLIKKSGHALGFGLLALSYWRALGFKHQTLWGAWILAVGYAITDEFHQAFTPGRIASVVDVLIDSIGAGLALVFYFRGRLKGQS